MNFHNQKFSTGILVTGIHNWVAEVRLPDATDEDLMLARQYSVVEGVRLAGQPNGIADSYIALAAIFEGEFERRHDVKRFEAQINSSDQAGKSSKHALWAVVGIGILQVCAAIFQALHSRG